MDQLGFNAGNSRILESTQEYLVDSGRVQDMTNGLHSFIPAAVA